MQELARARSDEDLLLESSAALARIEEEGKADAEALDPGRESGEDRERLARVREIETEWILARSAFQRRNFTEALERLDIVLAQELEFPGASAMRDACLAAKDRSD